METQLRDNRVNTEPRHFWRFALPPEPRGFRASLHGPASPSLEEAKTALRTLCFRCSLCAAGAPGPPALRLPRACPFRAALTALRGRLQGRKGKLTLKTKYSQQKLAGSPGLRGVIYVGEGGGLKRGNQQWQHLYHFVL